MGIVNRKLNRGHNDPVEVVEEIREPRNSTLTALVPPNRAKRLLRSISGKTWETNFYCQLLNESTPLNHIDLKEGKLAKSYNLVKRVPLAMQSELSFNYDEEQGETTLTGTGICPVGLYPNPGDVIIGNVDDGEDVIFTITSVSRLTHRKDTLYEVNFNSLAWVNDNPEFLMNLEPRIQETFIYDNYVDSFNSERLVLSDKMEMIENLRGMVYVTQDYFFKMFRQRYTQSFLIPGADKQLYDPIHNDFINRTVNTSLYGVTSSYGVTVRGEGYKENTIFDALIYRQNPKNNIVFVKQCAFMSTTAFRRSAVERTGQFFGMEFYLHPLDNRDRIINDAEKVAFGTEEYDPRNENNYSNKLTTEVVSKFQTKDIPLLPTLFDNDYYVMSELFYEFLESDNPPEGLSFLEVLVARYLQGNNIDVRDVHKVFETWQDWSMLHKFYLLPVMWILTRSTIGDL